MAAVIPAADAARTSGLRITSATIHGIVPRRFRRIFSIYFILLQYSRTQSFNTVYPAMGESATTTDDDLLALVIAKFQSAPAASCAHIAGFQ